MIGTALSGNPVERRVHDREQADVELLASMRATVGKRVDEALVVRR